MKQYTNESQTAKLIELGLPKPRCLHNCVLAYNIGELIEMLPPRYNGEDLEIHRNWGFEQWLIYYRGDDVVVETELIDALYAMILKLKEEGVI